MMRVDFVSILTGVSAVFPFALFWGLTLLKAFMMDPVIGWFTFPITVIAGLSVIAFQEEKT